MRSYRRLNNLFAKSMKIKSVRIKNLRSFRDQTVLFNDYSCLAGANGAGKSTVLCALNIFFRETGHSATDLTCLQEEDFHKKNTADPVEITVTFNDLNEEAQADFADYFRQGELVVSARATFDANTGRANVQQVGQRNVMAAFRPFFEALDAGQPVGELKALYLRLREGHSELPPPGTKQAMIDGLRVYEAARPEECALIPSSDQFYGFSKGGSRLTKYIQWVFIPAVKDADTEQLEGRDTALGKLLSRTVRTKSNFSDQVQALQAKAETEYQELMDSNQHTLDDLSHSLMGRLTEWAHPDATLKLQWRRDEARSVRVEEPLAQIVAGEGEFEGRLSRFGHGLQRCYLLALLQELASSGETENPTLILGFEEPELFQHPPQAQHLSDVLQGLTAQGSQVVVCTHSPYFVSGSGFEDMRIIRKSRTEAYSEVSQVCFDELAEIVADATGEPLQRPAGQLAKIHQALQPSLNEMFFTPFLLLVEGLEDVAYITTYLHLSGRWGEWRRLGGHMVPTSGKSNLIQPLAAAKLLDIPTFVVFDSDAHAPDRNGSRTKHEKDNRALLRLCGHADADPMPSDTCWGNGLAMWGSEMGTVVAADYGDEPWKRLSEQADLKYGHAGGLNKNSLHIAEMLGSAWDAHGPAPTLEWLCDRIIEFGNDVGKGSAETEAAVMAVLAARDIVTTLKN